MSGAACCADASIPALLPALLIDHLACLLFTCRYVEDWNATGVSFKYDADTAEVRMLMRGSGS